MNKLTLLEKILDNTETACYAVDYETLELVYLNHAIKKLVGMEDVVWKGRKCYEILQGKSKPCEFCTNAYLKCGESYKWENYNSLLKRYFELTDTLVEVDGRKLRLEFAFDVTAKKEELFRLKNKLTVEETLVRCIQTLSGEMDIQSAIYRLLAVVCDFYKADRAYIFEIDESEQTINNTYEWCRSGVSEQIDNLQHVPIETVSNWMDRFREQGCFLIENLNDDLDEDSADYKILKPQGIDKLMAAPIVKDNEIVGFLGVDNPSENVKDAVLLRSIALFIMDDLQKRKAVKELEKLSFVDALTGLYNRHKYTNEIVELSGGDGRSVGILYADINGLKAANDSFGHEYGDKLIMQSAALLKKCFSDSVFRVGGDEFIVLSYDKNAEQFDARVKKLRQALDKKHAMFMSLGSVWCEDSRHVNEHVTYADEFMYIDKQNYYKSSMGESKKYRATVASDLLNMINNGNFTVFLQPKVRLSDCKTVGAEALLRKFSDGKIIEPYKFMYVYEKTGLINYLDSFVMEEVCKIISSWQKRGIKCLPVSVNFSRYTVMEYNIAEKLKQVCNRYGVSPDLIMIEITEHVSDIKGVALTGVLESIKREGFRISLDDFGSEYSSLAVLTDVAFDEIKLDKSLVDKVSDSATCREVVKHLIGMCNALKDTDTLVEGIETDGQLKLLQTYECRLGQGYLFSRPLSVDDFTLRYLDKDKD